MSTWSLKIRELQSSGMTLADIGLSIGLATSTVGDLANGRSKSPTGDAALLLQSLHAERCSQAAAERAKPSHQRVG